MEPNDRTASTTWTPNQAAVLAAADEGRTILLAARGRALETARAEPASITVFSFPSGMAILRLRVTADRLREWIRLGGVVHVQLDDEDAFRIPEEREGSP